MKQFSTVDDYISHAPVGVQPKLKQLRTLIKSVVPEAQERISYGMPFYDYKGRLVYFAAQKHHLGLYIPPPIIEQHSAELSLFGTTKSAVQFPLDQDLPISLITTLIKARIAWNEKH